MAGLAARLPDALVGLLPDLRRALHLVDEHRPQALGDVVALLGVQVDGVEHRAEDVVLALVEGAVADPHGARAFVPLRWSSVDSVEVALPPIPYMICSEPSSLRSRSATYWMKSSASQSSPSACSPTA